MIDRISAVHGVGVVLADDHVLADVDETFAAISTLPERRPQVTGRFVPRTEESSDHHQEAPSPTKDGDSGHVEGER